MRLQNFPYTLDEGCRVELGAENFVWAVCEEGNAPVADKCQELPGLGGLDLGTERFRVVDTGFTFDVDENELILTSLKQRQSFADSERGVNFKTGDTKNLIAQRTQRLASAYMKNYGFRSLGKFHCSLIINDDG